MATVGLQSGEQALKSSNVLELQGHNAVAITDTSAHDVTLDVSDLGGRKNIVIANSLNQAGTLTVYAYNSSLGSKVSLGTKALTASTNEIVLPSDIAGLGEPLQQITLSVTCSTAPTSGTLSTWVEGLEK